MLRRLVILVFLSLGLKGVHVYAQDLEKDLKYFYTGFMFLPSIECEMEAKAYNKADNSFFFNRKVKLIVHNNQFYYNMGDMIYISNKHYLMWLDNKEKRMVVGRTSINEVAEFRKKLIGESDSMTFKNNGEVVYEGISNGIKSYKIINLKNELIKQVNITFESSTGFLKKMEIILNGDGFNTVASSCTEFTHIDIKPKVNESIFDLEPYFSVKNNQVIVSPKYKNYELISIDQSLLDRIRN